MSNGLQKVSQRKQVRSALERIDLLEVEQARVINDVNQAFNNQSQQFGRLANIVQAMVEILGGDVVDSKIKEMADAKALANLNAAQAALEHGLKTGEVVKADTIGEKTLVVGREFDNKGEVVFPGRAQLRFGGIRPDFQEKLKGQAAGFKMETDNGGSFEVLEIYDIVEKAAATAEATADAAPADAALLDGDAVTPSAEASAAPQSGN